MASLVLRKTAGAILRPLRLAPVRLAAWFTTVLVTKNDRRRIRGLDMLNVAYHYMDEDSLPRPTAWLRRHDQYGR
jgi:hypothetical protein